MKTSATIKTDTSDVYPQSVPMPSAALRQELPDIGTWADGIGSWYQTLKLVLQRANAASVTAQDSPIVVEGNSVLGRDNSVAGQPVSLTADTEGQALVFTNGVLGFSTLYITYIENLKNTINTKLSISENLSDIADVRTARANLGLGTAALLNAPASGDAGPGQVVLGNDTRFGSGGGGGAPTGPAGGDLSGFYPNPGVHQVVGAPAQPISTTSSPTFAGVTAGTGTFSSVSVASLTASSAISTSILQYTQSQVPVVTFSALGATNLNFTLGDRQLVHLSGNCSFNAVGLASVFHTTFVFDNVSGITITLSWPAWTVSGAAMPTSLAAGQGFTLECQVTGTTVASVYAMVKSDLTTSSTVGGDLAGSLPNPTLAVIGSATGPIGDSTHVAQVTIDAKGRVTGLTSVAITGGGGGGVDDYIYNVKNTSYSGGAVGNGSTDDTTAITAAMAACASAGVGTVFFPDGRYLISNELVMTLGATAKCGIKGSSMYGVTIIQNTASKNGIRVDMSGGGSGRAAHVEVSQLSFNVGSGGPTCAAAVILDYGTGSYNQHLIGGSSVHDIRIWTNDTDSGGWVNGVYMRNCWSSFIDNIWGSGQFSTYAGGGSNAGGGAFITIEGGTNQQINQCYYEYWFEGVALTALGGGSGLTPQGVKCRGLNCVETKLMYHAYKNTGNAGCDALSISDCFCDNGNTGNAGLAIRLECANHVYISNLDSRGSGMSTSQAVVSIEDSSYVYMTNSQLIFNTGYAIYLSAPASIGSSLCVITTTFCNGHNIRFDSSCNDNTINNVGSSTINNFGSGNTTLPGIF